MYWYTVNIYISYSQRNKRLISIDCQKYSCKCILIIITWVESAYKCAFPINI